MDPLTLQLSVVGLALAGAGVIGAWMSYAARKRAEAMSEMARRMGWEFRAKDRELLRENLMGLRLFEVGRGREFMNVLRGGGEGKERILLFDYSYTEGSGKNQHTVRQSVAAFERAGRGLPRFELRPENLLHKIGSVFGYQDIDFKGFPGFSKAYLLRGQVEDDVRKVFKPMALQYLESNRGWCVEGWGDWLVMCREGRRADPKDIPAFLEDARALNIVFPIRT
ncbi:MAG: hypothetical protein HY922_05850 [Elusimicrobia bacterium]|nr:hypothetical protein [Elusimicrobiota bacterium]